MKSIAVVLLFVSALLSGCATSNLSKEQVGALGAVRLVPQMTALPKPVFHGVATNFEKKGWLGPVISELDRPKDDVLNAFLSDKKIDVKEIMFEQFAARLKTTAFGPKMSDQGGNEIKITIVKFGLEKGWGFANNMKPSITAVFTMTDSAGAIIHTQEAAVGGITGELPARPMEGWTQDPEALRAGYADAAKRLADLLLSAY